MHTYIHKRTLPWEDHRPWDHGHLWPSVSVPSSCFKLTRGTSQHHHQNSLSKMGDFTCHNCTQSHTHAMRPTAYNTYFNMAGFTVVGAHSMHTVRRTRQLLPVTPHC